VASESSEEEIEVLVSVRGIKNTHFNITPLNEIFMGTVEGHMQVFDFNGKQVIFVPLVSLKTENFIQGGKLPAGATL